MNGNVKDMRGKRFGRLTALEYAGSRRKRAQWYCICDCSNKTVVGGTSLRLGNTKSCGCLSKETTNFLTGQHDMCNTSEYRAWRAAKSRCNNPNNISFKNYGERGIKMCKAWSDDFVVFVTDMGKRPSSKHSLDRNDNDGDYGPNNCRWATRAEQNRNSRQNRFLTFRNRTYCFTDWANILGMNRRTLRDRFDRGWSIEKAFTTPIRSMKR